jgi:glycolate oxidase iron-sulfur subunit
MKTEFTSDQRTNPIIQAIEENLRKCVHCGFCLSACPTYSVLGDERDSPRGRIYLIKDMLEQGGAPNPEIVTHVDRCLSCLACMSACPSGVHYQHYIDHARAYVEEHHQRPWFDSVLRAALAIVLPYAGRFRLALRLAKFAQPVAFILGSQLAAMINMAPANIQKPTLPDGSQIYPAEGQRKKRVALLLGCAQKVLRPSINEATIRLLTRLGCEVVVSNDVGCCGALTHHLGKDDAARDFAQANIDAWQSEIDGEGLDAIVINAAGCGTEVKDYAYLFKEDPAYRELAQKISDLTKDISEIVADLELPSAAVIHLPAVVYHDACSLMHGQGITVAPRQQLQSVGFDVAEIPGRHYCCGSAGSYNLLQPEMAGQLKDQRIGGLDDVLSENGAQILATGNIGCLVQLASGTDIPIVHTVELLDWATGGPRPDNL